MQGYAPLGARTEQLSSVSQKHRAGLRIEEVTIHSEPGVKLSGLLVSPMSKGKGKEKQEDVDVDVVVLYLQGNAGNPLHRLPVFQSLLLPPLPAPRIAVFACAPRSYWKSTRRRPYSWVATIQTWLGHILPSAKPLSSSSFSSAPYPTSTYLPNLPQHIRAKTRGPSQTALLTDYTYALHYALSRFPRASIVLYGHSLGGAAAVCLITGLRDGCASDSLSPGTNKDQMQHDYNRIRGLILENPFSSIQGMVRALYPEKWVPYRYLTSFVLDRWDAVGALQEVCQDQSEDNADKRGSKKKANPTISRAVDDMLILVSENDEIVPLEMGLEVFEVSRTASRYQGGKLVIIRGALHENAWEKREWEKEMKGYLERIYDKHQVEM